MIELITETNINMTIRNLSIVFLIFTLSCSSNQKKSHNKYEQNVLKNLIDSTTYIFEVDNYNPNYLGFETIEMSPASGFSSFFIMDSIMYISDSYHNNLKKFIIRDSICEFQAKSNKIEDIMVGDIYCLNDTLMILSRNELKLRLFNTDFSPINSIDLNGKERAKFVYYNDQVYISHSTINDTVILYSIPSLNKYKELKISSAEFLNQYWSHTKLWFYSQNDSSKIINNRYGSFAFAGQVPSLIYLEGENIRYSNGNIYTISDQAVIEGSKYILKVYSYE